MANLREQFLERLLREFFHTRGSGFALKGGGAVRALFQGQRLTKDIDLDFINPKRTADSLHNTVNRAIANAARGLPITNLKTSSPAKGEQTPRWKINFADRDGKPFHVEIEVSRDPKRAPPGNVVQKPFTPEAQKGIARFWVDVYDEPALVATKLAALLGREVPRDAYDLDLLMAAGQPPSVEQIRWALARTGVDNARALHVLRARLDGLTWERFQTELADALPEPIRARIDAAEWEALKERVNTYALKLLHAEADAPP